VDDGSTDESPTILEEYAAVDSRLRVLHQQNQYAGVARNNGMAQARGEYLMFWDSDDYFDLTALEKLYNQCEADRADICVCGGKRFYEESQHEVITRAYLRMNRVPEEIPFNRATNPDGILTFTETATWNKLYRKSFLEEKGISFKPPRNGNDVFFSILALCEARRITVVNEHLVSYRRHRPGSLVSTLTAAPLSLLAAWVEVRQELIRRGIFPKKSFDRRAVGVVKQTFLRVKTWEAFEANFNYLQDKGLEELGLEVQPEGYYPEASAVFLEKLIEGNSHALLLYLLQADHERLVELADTRVQNRAEIKRLKKQIKNLSQEVRTIKGSRAYRIGRAVLSPLKTVKDKFSRK
jgi:Glycosyltransferases, probably involved in cell wall biogenesis